MRHVEQERPTIKIFVHSNHNRGFALQQVQYGIEEEGIPYETADGGEYTARELGWEASQQSRLEVGIGLDRDTLVLHYGKLEPNVPLFCISARAPAEEIRAIGANAARLVKKLPFKPCTRR